MGRFIPSSGTGFPRCGRKMITSTASSVPHLRSRISWDNPRRGRRVVVVTNLYLKATLWDNPRRGRRVVVVTNLYLKATLWNPTALCADVLLGSLVSW